MDVGSVRVGLAACDPAGVMASPVRTLTRDAGHDADVAEVVAEAVQRRAVEVLVGLPLSMDGTQGPAALRALEYAAKIGRSLPGVPVRMVDERLSTVDAHRALHAAGKKEKQFRSVVDQVAAVVLLQAALDTERTSGRAPGRVMDVPKARPKRRKRGQGETSTVQVTDGTSEADERPGVRPDAMEGWG